MGRFHAEVVTVLLHLMHQRLKQDADVPVAIHKALQNACMDFVYFKMSTRNKPTFGSSLSEVDLEIG